MMIVYYFVSPKYFSLCFVKTASQILFSPSNNIDLGQAKFKRIKQSEFWTNIFPPSNNTPAR